MGFISGFTGGVTLTLGIAYLTVLAHERHRRNQASALRSQTFLLTTLLDKTPAPPSPTRQELARHERSSLIELAKDRWNAEVSGAIRWAQEKDWAAARDGLEDRVAAFWARGLKDGRQAIQQGESAAGNVAQRVAVEAKEGLQRAGAKVENTTGRMLEDRR